MKYIETDGSNQDFIILCHLLDEYLNTLAGGEENRGEYIPYNSLSDIHDVIVVYKNQTPVGCAAFKYFNSRTAEVKRVFIKEELRGLGISRQLMEQLEIKAKRQGYTTFVLESGKPLVEAMSLYRSIGYKIIPNYGPYVDMVESVCMEKNLL